MSQTLIPNLITPRRLSALLGCLVFVLPGISLLTVKLRAQPLEGKPVILREVGHLKLMAVGAGSFLMGSSTGDYDEPPVTRVTISQAYWLGATGTHLPGANFTRSHLDKFTHATTQPHCPV